MHGVSASVGALLLALTPAMVSAQTTLVATDPAPEFDYVQQAGSLSFDGDKLTLFGLAPATLYFSDRPYRMAGQVDTKTFVKLWAADGSFAADPPNAAITTLGDPDASPAIIELTSAEIDGANIIYGVTVLSGALPEAGTDVALFIDRGEQPRRLGVQGGVRGRPQTANRTGYYPYHPVPGPYCYHAPQDPECHYHPYHPYYPYYPPPYYPGAAYAAGVATGAAIANQPPPPPVYIYPIPQGPLPTNCYINSTHTEMICSVPLPQQ